VVIGLFQQGLTVNTLERMIKACHSSMLKQWMYMSTNAFKVTAFEGDKLIAEYIFAFMKEAIQFEIRMREKNYTTKMDRIEV
jgi:hypothetical protein